MRRLTAASAVAALAIVTAGCGSSGSGGSGGSGGGGTPQPPQSASPLPSVRPADFAGKVDNPWFPLTPGTILTYTGTKDGEPSRDVFTITRDTQVIDGVSCVVVHDNLFVNGTLAERTTDWYAQDRQGNVWYFGEATEELDESGHVTSTEGSWKAGVDGAQAGIYMPALPVVGQIFRQEYYKGHAEDYFQVVSLTVPVEVPAVPAASTTNALQTKEWTPLEPDVVGQKYYVRGVGIVKEEDVSGSGNGAMLVSVGKVD